MESWPPVVSGYAMRSGALADALARRPDIDPVVLVTSRQHVYRPAGSLEPRSYPVRGVAPSALERVARRAHAFAIDGRELRRRIIEVAAEHRSQVIHTSWGSTVGAASLEAADRLGVPLLAEVRFDLAGATVSQSHWPLGPLEGRLRRHFERHLGRAGATVAASDGVADMLRRDRPDRPRAVVVPNGVGPAPAVDPESVRRRRAALGGDGRVLIGSTGKQLRYEGLDLLIDVLASWPHDQPTPTLVLVGRGPEAERLRRRADSTGAPVRFIDSVPRSQVGELLAAFDIFAVPRRQATVTEWASPLKVTEALSSGCCVVGSAVGDLARLLGGGRGRLVAPGSKTELHQALVELAGDPGARRLLGQRARAWAEHQPDWDDAAHQLAVLAHQLVATPGLDATSVRHDTAT